MLRRHPQIYMPDVKEPWFFADDLALRFEPTTPLPKTLDEYLSLFLAAEPDQRVGEATPSYLFSRAAAGNIADLQPDARIIAILREPASFLRSLHLQSCCRITSRRRPTYARRWPSSRAGARARTSPAMP